MNYDDLKLSVEAMSGGKNTVILDDLGKPSVMVSIPKMSYADIMEDGSSETLPCFIVDGQELDQIWVSKYLNIVVDDRAYSLPGKDPATSMTFERTLEVCRNKGAGWSLMPNGLWGAIHGLCLKNNFLPHGNTNYGSDITYSHEKGVCSYSENNTTHRTSSGSGPATWYHDGTSSGIADMVGNVMERCTGLRLVDGEIQIIPDGTSMKSDCDLSESSPLWQAILPNGTLVSGGTEGTLKYNLTSSSAIPSLSTKVDYMTDSTFGTKLNLVAAEEDTSVPILLQVLGLYRISNTVENTGTLWIATSGERIPARGGNYLNGISAGIVALNLSLTRSLILKTLGFRSVYYEMP